VVSQRNWKFIVLLGAIFFCLALAIPACRPAYPLVGRWRTEPPASLLYEYQTDGAVLLVQDSEKFVVFHYQLIDENTFRLYDGMGRVRQYDFRISGKTLLLYDDLASGVLLETYHRE
jgi:hypothetical protein